MSEEVGKAIAPEEFKKENQCEISHVFAVYYPIPTEINNSEVTRLITSNKKQVPGRHTMMK